MAVLFNTKPTKKHFFLNPYNIPIYKHFKLSKVALSVSKNQLLYFVI